MRMSDTRAYECVHRSLRVKLVHLPMVLHCIVFVLVVIAMARPTVPSQTRNGEGIDIMMAMDVSTSMLAEDINPNRMEAAKEVAAEFVSHRPNDNIGLTIFAGEAFTQCPMTTDHASLLSLLNNVRTDLAMNGLIEDGTAIGMGLANAISRLKESKAKSKVVILLTDGSNNRGDISPMTAADIAKSFGIRVYTIGFGTNGETRFPVPVDGAVRYIKAKGDIDYNTLQDIALATNGYFYRATSRGELSRIYKDIDKLEKTKMVSKGYARRADAYQPFVLAAFATLLLEVLLKITVFRRMP